MFQQSSMLLHLGSLAAIQLFLRTSVVTETMAVNAPMSFISVIVALMKSIPHDPMR